MDSHFRHILYIDLVLAASSLRHFIPLRVFPPCVRVFIVHFLISILQYPCFDVLCHGPSNQLDRDK